MASLISFATDAAVQVGDTLTLTRSGDWAELVSFQAPYDDEDPGSVTVRHSWGELRQYEPSAVGCYITD